MIGGKEKNKSSTEKSSTEKTLIDVKTIEGFPKIVSQLRSTIKHLTGRTELVKKISLEHISDLDNAIGSLKALINDQQGEK